MPAPADARLRRWASITTLIALVGVRPTSLGAQIPDSAAVADSATAAVARATALYGSSQRPAREEAVAFFRAAAAQYERAGDRTAQAEALRSSGTVLNSLGHPDSALAQYRTSLSISRQIGDRRGEAATLSESGEALLGLGQVDSALVVFRSSLTIATELRDSSELGYGYSNLGTAFKALGRLDSALVYLDRAFRLREAISDTLGMGVTLNNLSTTYQALGRYDSSIVVLRRSLILRRAANNRVGEGTTLNNLGYAFEFRDRDSALTYYREALPILEEAGRRSTAAITLGNMGRVFLEQGERDSARTYLDRSIGLSRETGNRSAESWAANDLGRLHTAQGHRDTAGVWYATALALERSIGDRRREGETLQNLATLHHRAPAPANLLLATAYYDSAAGARSEVGGFAGGDANRVSFLEQDSRLYEEWALAWLARASELGPAPAAWAALAASERGRAQALLELIRARRRRSPADSARSPGGFAPGADLGGEGRGLVPALGTRATAAVVYLVTDDTLVTWLLPRGGDPVIWRVAVGRDSLAALVGASRLALRVDGAVQEPGTRAAAGPAGTTASTPRASRSMRALDELRVVVLPDTLLSYFTEGDELVLVPQGMLALVPFAALRVPVSGTSPQYLGTRYALRFTPSLSLLRESGGRTTSLTGTGASLVVGDPRMPMMTNAAGERIRLPPLPNAGHEAQAVARTLKTTALTGGAASEAAVRRRIGSASVVHLATHGFAYSSEARARQSFVALAPGDGQDGLLTVAELLDDPGLGLRAELVVLSACQTGLGDLKRAEGTVGLQRALLARGARSVLVSQWSVSDVATARLMASFYRHWIGDHDHPTRAEALRRAQGDIQRTPGLGHPRFWAAFQLVGAD